MKVLIASFLAALVFGIIGFFVGAFSADMETETVVIKEPLFIKNNKGDGKIPEGTTLFFNKSMKEGVSSYKIYVNIDGKPLEVRRSEKKWFVAPIWGEFKEKSLKNRYNSFLEIEKMLKKTCYSLKKYDVLISNYKNADQMKNEECNSEYVNKYVR